MRWRVAIAKERFAELIRAAAAEPQLILNRDRLVAAVVAPETYHAFEEWRHQQGETTLAGAFAELSALCAEEGYELEIASRVNRPDAFADASDRLPA